MNCAMAALMVDVLGCLGQFWPILDESGICFACTLTLHIRNYLRIVSWHHAFVLHSSSKATVHHSPKPNQLSRSNDASSMQRLCCVHSVPFQHPCSNHQVPGGDHENSILHPMGFMVAPISIHGGTHVACVLPCHAPSKQTILAQAILAETNLAPGWQQYTCGKPWRSLEKSWRQVQVQQAQQLDLLKWPQELNPGHWYQEGIV
jgi:hypothetical protein